MVDISISTMLAPQLTSSVTLANRYSMSDASCAVIKIVQDGMQWDGLVRRYFLHLDNITGSGVHCQKLDVAQVIQDQITFQYEWNIHFNYLFFSRLSCVIVVVIKQRFYHNLNIDV